MLILGFSHKVSKWPIGLCIFFTVNNTINSPPVMPSMVQGLHDRIHLILIYPLTTSLSSALLLEPVHGSQQRKTTPMAESFQSRPITQNDKTSFSQ